MTAAVRERPRTDVGSGTIASHRAAPARNTRARTTTGSRSRPKLKVLNQEAIRQRARRRNALLTLFILVLLGFFAVAFIQAQLVADQQDLDVLRARIAEAETDNARIARDVEIASSPVVIVGRAKELGMVRAYQPVYLEAVAPLRDIPNAPVFDPATPQGFELAAPQAASATGINAGISTDASVSAAEPSAAVEAMPAQTTIETPTVQAESLQPAPVEPAAVEPAAEATLTTSPAATSSSLGGVVAASDQAAAGGTVSTATPAASAAAPGSVAGAGSIAGSRAVTGGSGSG